MKSIDVLLAMHPYSNPCSSISSHTALMVRICSVVGGMGRCVWVWLMVFLLWVNKKDV